MIDLGGRGWFLRHRQVSFTAMAGQDVKTGLREAGLYSRPTPEVIKRAAYCAEVSLFTSICSHARPRLLFRLYTCMHQAPSGDPVREKASYTVLLGKLTGSVAAFPAPHGRPKQHQQIRQCAGQRKPAAPDIFNPKTRNLKVIPNRSKSLTLPQMCVI